MVLCSVHVWQKSTQRGISLNEFAFEFFNETRRSRDRQGKLAGPNRL